MCLGSINGVVRDLVLRRLATARRVARAKLRRGFGCEGCLHRCWSDVEHSIDVQRRSNSIVDLMTYSAANIEY